ncbi:hypothetical protein [Micromonospora rosaria]|nr:hypothetical protein [Micromonospora rosaria]
MLPVAPTGPLWWVALTAEDERYPAPAAGPVGSEVAGSRGPPA